MRKIVIDNRVKKRGKSGIPLYAERFLGLKIKGYHIAECSALSSKGKLGILLELLPNLRCEFDSTINVIIHINNNIPILINPFKNRIVVIHDLGPIVHPEFYSLQARLMFRAGLFFALRFSSKILLISNSVKSELVNFFPKHSSKAQVNHNFLLDTEVNDIGGFKIDTEKYFVIFSGTSKRKNIYQFLSALNAIANTDRNFKIKVIGGLSRKEFRNLDIEIYENIPNNQVNALLYNSIGLLFPSMYEGFGYPLVHAMTYSKSIFCGRTAINKEVLGDYEHTYYHDIFDFKDIENVYQKLLENSIKDKKPIKIPIPYTKSSFEQKMLEFL